MDEVSVESFPRKTALLASGGEPTRIIPSGASLLSLLEQQRHRQDVFCHFWQDDIEQEVRFAELFAEASRFRRLYVDAAIAPGATIVIATDFSLESLYAFIGAMIGGFVPAFLAPFTERQHLDQFAKTVSGVIEYTRPGAIVASPEFDRDLIPPGTPLILTSQVEGIAAAPHQAWVTRDPDDVAFMQFSSGTTGLRKGVLLDHGAVVAQIRAFVQVAPLGEGDLIASWLPLYHDMGLIACFIIPIATGVPIALQNPIEWAREPHRLLEAIERHRATYVWLPNFAFNHLRLSAPDDTRFDLSSIKAFINCSEPCKPNTVDAFVERFANDGVRPDMVSTSYAMAEAVFAVTQAPLGRIGARLLIDRERLDGEGRLVPAVSGREGREILSAGRLLPNMELRILDEDFASVEEGRVGQIAIRGDYVFGGYYNNVQDTQAAFHNGWFLTGDLGAVIDGEVFVTGRLKDIIIAYGRNFYAHDIEDCVARVADVKPGRVAAFAIENDILGSEEVVVVAETTLEPGQYRDLIRRIKQAVAETLGLSAIRPYPVSRGWLVKTTSGKMSRRENREKYIDERRSAAGGAAI